VFADSWLAGVELLGRPGEAPGPVDGDKDLQVTRFDDILPWFLIPPDADAGKKAG
jgi:hypothetical protein